MSEEIESEDERQSSHYDLLCTLVDPQQARHVTRILTELCACDENSYPFLQGILSVTQLRLLLTLPDAVVKSVNDPLEIFHKELRFLLEEFYKNLRLLLEESKHNQLYSGRVEQSIEKSGWPFATSYKGKVARSFQSFIRHFEQKSAYRVRWLALVGLLFVTSCLIGLNEHYNSLIARIKQLEFDQYSTLQTSATEQSTKLEKRYAASIEQRSNEIAKEKLQHLEPRSYHLAQLIEKAARRVQTAKGTILWEVSVHEGPDSPLPDCTFDNQQNWNITFYLPDTDGEIALSATAASVDPKPKAKYRQGLLNKAN